MRVPEKKKSAMVIALLCIAALLLSGTFAYYNSVKAINTFQDDYYTDIILHDDYDVDGDDGDSSYHEKKVYVENVGEIPLFVRITLEEYMEYDYNSYPAGAARKNNTQDNSGEDNQEHEGEGGEGAGSSTDGLTTQSVDLSESNWHIHAYSNDSVTGEISCADCGEVYHTFFSWILGGDAYTHGGATDWISSKDTYKYRKATSDEIEEGVARRYQDGQDLWNDIDSAAERYSYTNGGEESAVMSMQEYWQKAESGELDQDTFTGWILDEDGYAYWSQKLSAGEATGVLLGAIVEEMLPPGDEYYYGIDVILEAVDEADLGSWLNGTEAQKTGIIPGKAATANGRRLLNRLTSLTDRNELAEQIAQLEAGDVIEIGIEGMPGYNGETLEWIVLKNDGVTAELITKEMVTGKRFSAVSANWEQSDLRTYLRTDFFGYLPQEF